MNTTRQESLHTDNFGNRKNVFWIIFAVVIAATVQIALTIAGKRKLYLHNRQKHAESKNNNYTVTATNLTNSRQTKPTPPQSYWHNTSNDNSKHKNMVLFEQCIDGWQLPQQKYDDVYTLILELIVGGSLIAIGFGPILWFAFVPLLIVLGPSILSVLLMSLKQKKL